MPQQPASKRTREALAYESTSDLIESSPPLYRREFGNDLALCCVPLERRRQWKCSQHIEACRHACPTSRV
jgi:hypothetical protein